MKKKIYMALMLCGFGTAVMAQPTIGTGASTDWRVGGNTANPNNVIGPFWNAGATGTAAPQMWFTTGAAAAQYRMAIFGGGTTTTDGQIAMGNNLPAAFVPTARLHLHQINPTLGGANNNFIRFSNNVTLAGAQDGMIIGTTEPGLTFYTNFEPRQPQTFFTNNGTANGTDERLRIHAQDRNGFVGIGNTFNYPISAQLHINDIGVAGAIPGLFGQLFRTDGNLNNINEWSMYTGTTPAVTNQVFNLRVPANSNNLQINTENNNAVIELRTFNGAENTIATITSTGSTGSIGLPARGGINIRPWGGSMDNNHFMNIGGPIKFSEPVNNFRTTLNYAYTTCNGPLTLGQGEGYRMMYEPHLNGAFGADYLVFQKTEDGTLNPDGGIIFTNLGNNATGTEAMTMMLAGTGMVGIGLGFQPAIQPHRRLEVFDNNGLSQLRLTNTLNPVANNEIYADFTVQNTGVLQIDPRNAGLTTADVRPVEINYGLGNAAPYPNLSLDVNGQMNIES